VYNEGLLGIDFDLQVRLRTHFVCCFNHHPVQQEAIGSEDGDGGDYCCLDTKKKLQKKIMIKRKECSPFFFIHCCCFWGRSAGLQIDGRAMMVKGIQIKCEATHI
jgi:hypothetical protein